MNKFYDQPIVVQWLKAILLCAIGVVPVLLISEKGYSQPIFYFLLLLYLPLVQFSLTPISKLTGIYHYYSPMLTAFIPTDEEIELHNGSSFDYLMIMRNYSAGVRFRYVILSYYLEGLLKIIEDIEKKERPNTVKIVGTSYFFNQRTAMKLDFSLEKPSFLHRLNLLVNFIDLTWMYSLSQGKPSFPNLLKVKKIMIDGKKLCENKNKITLLHDYLKKKLIWSH